MIVETGDIIRLNTGCVFIVTVANPYTHVVYGIYTDGSTFNGNMSDLEDRFAYKVIGHTDRLDNILYIIKNLDGALKCLERA